MEVFTGYAALSISGLFWLALFYLIIYFFGWPHFKRDWINEHFIVALAHNLSWLKACLIVLHTLSQVCHVTVFIGCSRRDYHGFCGGQIDRYTCDKNWLANEAMTNVYVTK